MPDNDKTAYIKILLKKEGNVDKKNIMAYKFKNSTTAHSVNKTLLDLKI